MTDKKKPQRITDVVQPGVDFAAKIKITEILGQEVLITNIDKVEGSPEFNQVDPETGEVVSRDYWNVEIILNDLEYTFSTGAVPIDKVLAAAKEKIEKGMADYPLIATFNKSGRTYTVS
jgi:hypothetical protein